MRKIVMAAAAVAALSTPTFAQVGNSQGLIPIQIQNVHILDNFLNSAQISALNGPITVQAPISVAANICGTTVALLAEARKNGTAGCTASSGSQALADIVNRQVLKHQ